MKQASSAFPPRGDAATIAAMVASARAAAQVEVVIPRHNARQGDDLWIIEETILLPSGTTVILDGARLVLADGVFCNLFANEHAWTPDRCSAAAEDRDIAIVGRDGALLDGGNYNQWGEQMSPDIGSHAMDGAAAKLAARPRPKPLVHNCPIYFHNVRGFRVEGVTVRHQRYWGMCFSFCSEGAIRRIRFEADISWVSDDGRVHDPSRRPNFYRNLWIKNGDGIDLRKGCHDIRIEGVTGWSEDDTIALTNLCGGEMNDVVEGKCHDICHVSIRDVRTYAWRWMNQVRLLCCDGARIHDVSIAGVRDTSDPAEQPWRMASSIQLNDESSEYFRSRNAALDFIEANLGTVFPLPGDPGVGRVTAVRDFDFTWGHDVCTLPRIAEWRLSRDLRFGALNRAYGTPEAPADIRLERGATLVPDEPPPRTALVEIAPGVRESYADTVYAPVNDELYRAAFSWAQLVREVRVRENGPDAFPARAEILAFDLGRLRAIGVKSYAIDTPVTAANAPEIWTMLRMIQRSDLAADAVCAYFCRKVFGKDAPDRYRFWAKQRERLIAGC